ncbi:hypothetical protein ABW19_dt0201039 [Dactylella cylindrospora]|nr:hypothetical protein ABW19_dt0201039 [Dactylella cylindrospora]
MIQEPVMSDASSKQTSRRGRPPARKGKLVISGKDADDGNSDEDMASPAEMEEDPIEDSGADVLLSDDSDEIIPEPKRRSSSHVMKKRRTGIDSNIAVVIDNRRTSRVSRLAAGDSPASLLSNVSSVSQTFDQSPTAETPATSFSVASTRASSKAASGRKSQAVDAIESEDEELIALSTTIKGKGASKTQEMQTPRRVGLRASTLSQSASNSRIYRLSSDDDEDYIEAGYASSDFDPEGALAVGNDDNDNDDDDMDFALVNALLPDSDDDDDEEEEDVPPPLPAPISRARGRRERKGRMTRAERERAELYIHHPYLETVWDELKACPPISVEKAKQPDGLTLTMLPFQLEGLNWLEKQEKTRFNGGILADEMGMGKTIQTIALLMEKPRPSKPTLVVAPTVALIQWRNEIEKHTDNALKVLIFHGNTKENKVSALNKFNVILTTYGSLESAFRKQNTGFKRKDGVYKEKSVLHAVDWHRVVLDEAHNIKDRSCNTARAVFALKTKYKLCLSGTPLQNRIGELFSLLRFLESDPFSMYFCRKCPCKSMHWKFSDYRHCDECGHRPMEHRKLAFEKLQSLLNLIMLRRTKVQRADDLGLPPRIVKVRRDYFNEEELDLYESIYSDSKRKFNTYVATGVVLNNYANIFSLITRMRQIADHPDLVLRRHSPEGQNNNLVCCICDEEAEEAIKSKCHHTFCRLCVQKYIDGYAGEGAPECPHCHISLSIDITQPALEADYDLVKKGSIINRIDMNNWRSSTKIEALVEELAKLRSKTCTIKSIVFSQFTSMLQLVEWRLRKAGFQTVMLEGSMTPAQRDASIRYFMENVEVEVFLVSLKAGGVALNLVEASQVFIMDPWWNPSVEWQSGDRIHRIGQTRNCRITRLVIQDSIESRIIELQEKKANMINATIGADQAAMEKLSPADMQFLFNN